MIKDLAPRKLLHGTNINLSWCCDQMLKVTYPQKKKKMMLKVKRLKAESIKIKNSSNLRARVIAPYC